ncbi:MAG TPA: hypothetical protein PKI24_14950 [Nitrospira sp.]|nr:hypothetical protein [Nitrospira sp.]HNK48377.1 hypothetical protein [Nitrospira sp.]HNP40898.1 hypothetical protein [Nitrospira sp.]
MSDNDLISSYSTDKLLSYYADKVKQPAWLRWFRNADIALDKSKESLPSQAGKFVRLGREITNEMRYRSAMWKWLHPANPTLCLDELSSLQKLTAFDHLDSKTFLRGLRDHCREFMRQHPQLRLWIEKRNALLDFAIEQACDIPEQLSLTAIALRQAQNQTYGLISDGQSAQAIDMAGQISERAMYAAVQAVLNVLGKNKTDACPASANLMVPCRVADLECDGFLPNELARQNHARAARLWKHLAQPNKCLVVIAETAEAGHLGFWVPLDSGGSRLSLAGAPTAFIHQEGTAVFKDDLPLLQGVPDALAVEWTAYMKSEFQEQMFVSLPFIVPKTDTVGGKLVAGVLNVNASPPSDDGWRRAYHKEWLALARKNIDQFVEVAFIVNKLKSKARTNQDLKIDTGSSLWDSLPYALIPPPAPKMLSLPKKEGDQ